MYEGFALANNIKRLDVAGRHLTEYMIKLLLLRGYTFNRSADFETVRELKEKASLSFWGVGRSMQIFSFILVEEPTTRTARAQ